MISRMPETTIRTSVEFSRKPARGTVTLHVHESGKETLHRLPLPETASSEIRAHLLAVHEALQWSRRLQKRRVIVITEHEDAYGILKRQIPVNEHVAGPFLQISALSHAFDAVDVKCIPPARLAAAV